ncbi:MAG: hypothetical protein WCG27_09200, partial [Pseudomonadota bacterium]
MNIYIMTPNRLTSWPAIFLFTFLGIILFLLVEWSPLDLWLQDFFFNFAQKKWMVDRDSFLPKLIFYNGIKYLLALSGIIALG